MSRTASAASNSLWYGLENIVSVVCSFAVSILVARTLGPQKLGYYSYIYFLTSAIGTLEVSGISRTVHKFMADHIGGGFPGRAKAVYRLWWKKQVLYSIILAAACLVAAWLFAERTYFTCSVLLIASMPFRILAFLPSVANQARDKFRANVLPSFLNMLVSNTFAALSPWMGWDVTGIAFGVLAGCMVELYFKSRSVETWLATVQADFEGIADQLDRMKRFAKQGLWSAGLSLVVFDRSDLIFLRMFGGDSASLAYFTLSAGIVERLLLIPKIVTEGIGMTMVTDYAKDPKGSARYMDTALRYILVIGAMFLLCGAALSDPLIRLLYGKQYLGVIPLMAVACVLAVPKATLVLAQRLCQVHDRQDLVVNWGFACGALNIVLDLTLIPLWGVMGAVVANGTTQFVSCVGLWLLCVWKLQIPLRLTSAARALGVAGGMAAVAFLFRDLTPPVLALAVAAMAASAAALLLIRTTGFIQSDDLGRLSMILKRLPAPAMRLVGWLAAKPRTA